MKDRHMAFPPKTTNKRHFKDLIITFPYHVLSKIR